MNWKLMSVSIWAPGFLGLLLPIVLPIGHILYIWFFWSDYARFIDRNNCTCSCWDTVFKGTYESGVARYKHFYFNATDNMVKIWVLTVIVIIVFYECVKHLIRLMFAKKARYSMIVLFCLSIFPHYYAWWINVNYYNDDFYNQWNHQMFFTITELFSTIAVFHLADTDNLVTQIKVFCIVGIAILHILASGLDQFIWNVLKGEGELHQIIRDCCLMAPDILNFILPIWLLQKQRREDEIKPFYRDYNLFRDAIITVIAVAVLMLIWTLL